MLNSGAPGVMLDLEDSMANRWPNLLLGIGNILAALHGKLTYYDRKRKRTVGIRPSDTVIWKRVRGLHLAQAGVLPDPDELTSASLFDLAMIAYQVDPAAATPALILHPEVGVAPRRRCGGATLFRAMARRQRLARRLHQVHGARRIAPARVPDGGVPLQPARSHPGLNLGRWDYMASLIHFNLRRPRVGAPRPQHHPARRAVLPATARAAGRDLPQARRARDRRHDRALPEPRGRGAQRARARVLEKDKRNEAGCLMDGAWTGHPDQNAIAVAPVPGIRTRSRRDRAGVERYPDLRPVPKAWGRRTLDGTRAAVRTVIRYRNGVLERQRREPARRLHGGPGHRPHLPADDRPAHTPPRVGADRRRRAAAPSRHTPEFVSEIFDQALEHMLRELPPETDDAATRQTSARPQNQRGDDLARAV